MQTDESLQHEQQTVQTQLLHLPNELLHRVSDCLDDIADILKLRLACVRLSIIGLEQLQKRMTKIYVAPSKASLQRFQDICQQPFFADHITEIIYNASLQALDPEDITAGHEFQKISQRYGSHSALVDHVLALCKQRKEEQEKLLADGEVGAVLSQCVSLLPKLRTLTYRAQVYHQHYEYCVGKYANPIEPPVYNNERIWSASNSSTDFEKFKDQPLHVWAEFELLRSAHIQTGIPGRWHDSPKPLVQCLATLSSRGMSQPIELVLKDCEPRVLDDHWSSFAENDARDLRAAMAQVRTLTMNVRHSSAGYHSGQEFRAALWAGVDRWVGFVQQAHHITHVKLIGCFHETGSEFSELSRAIMSNVTWPELQSLAIHAGNVLNSRDAYDEDDPPNGEFKVEALVDFLLRHKKTLRTLDLIGATGYGTASELKEGLRRLQVGMSALRHANILVMHDVQESRYGPDLNTPADTDWKARDRAVEQGSGLGILARELGVKVQEIMDPDDADESRARTDYIGPDGGGTWALNLLKYEYDFGPYVLCKASGGDL